MKILIHDFAGHPFQVELSRELARRGYHVVHAYFTADPGPKGVMEDCDFADGRVEVVGLDIDRAYSKANLVSRLLGDLQYRRVLFKRFEAHSFDVILSSNTPTWVQGGLLKLAKRSNAKFIYWCQDFYSIAVGSILSTKLGLLGNAIGVGLQVWDRWQMRRSDHVLHITEKFKETTDSWGIPSDRVSVIPNWGAIAEIPVLNKETAWGERNGIDSERAHILYAGTLGLKHNPYLIRDASQNLPDAQFTVVGSGVGMSALQSATNLKLLPLQSFKCFPEALASADVLIAMIEKEAGDFSVPSKVLSYLCAGRPIVLAASKSNLASFLVTTTGAGLVVEPEDHEGFINAIGEIIADKKLGEKMGRRGRRYAEENFAIDSVAERFAALFGKVTEMPKL